MLTPLEPTPPKLLTGTVPVPPGKPAPREGPAIAPMRPEPVPVELIPVTVVEVPPTGTLLPGPGRPFPKLPSELCTKCAPHLDDDWLEELTVTMDGPPLGTWCPGWVPG